MTSSITRSYNTPTSYTYDSDKIEITGGKAQLKIGPLVGLTFEQAFTSSSGFTYDSNYSEFSGGEVQMKDTRPANATLYSDYETDIGANWGSGTAAGIAVGGADVSSGLLDLAHNDLRYVKYNGDNISGSPQVGTFELPYIANYNGNPASNQYIRTECKAMSDTKNLIELIHLTSGQLRLTIKDSAGTTIFASNLGVFAPVLGTTYYIKLTYDLTTGSTMLYVNGGAYSGQFGITQTGTGTRDSNIGIIIIGSDSGGISTSNFSLEGMIDYSVVTSLGFDDASPTLYITDLITMPEFTYTALGSVQAFTGFTVTETGSPRFIVNDEYWNGSAFVTSDGSWAQSSPKADINTNIASLTASDSVIIKIRTNSGAVQMKVDNLVLTYTGQVYGTTNPTVVHTEATNMSDLLTFSANANATGSDAIKYSIVVGGVDKYWSGSAWVNSSGYSQSNTEAELNTNVSSLLSSRSQVKIKVYLHSDDGSTRPDIEDFTFTYNASLPDPTSLPRLVDVNGFIYDMNGACSGVEVKARPYVNGYQNPNDGSGGGVFQKYAYEVIATTDSDGFFSGDIYLQPTGQYIEFRIGKQSYYTQLPDQDAVDFNTLTLTLVS